MCDQCEQPLFVSGGKSNYATWTHLDPSCVVVHCTTVSKLFHPVLRIGPRLLQHVIHEMYSERQNKSSRIKTHCDSFVSIKFPSSNVFLVFFRLIPLRQRLPLLSDIFTSQYVCFFLLHPPPPSPLWDSRSFARLHIAVTLGFSSRNGSQHRRREFWSPSRRSASGTKTRGIVCRIQEIYSAVWSKMLRSWMYQTMHRIETATTGRAKTRRNFTFYFSITVHLSYPIHGLWFG